MRKIKFQKYSFYHILNRGVDKRPIFNGESDMWRFLQGLFLFNDENVSSGILREIERQNNGRLNFVLLKEFVEKNRDNRDPLVKIVADCLMPNHFHLILQEIKEGGISRFMHKLGTGYTCYFNKKNDRTGSLFQGPFKAVLIDNDLYFKYLLVYINIINPGQLIGHRSEEKRVEKIENILKFAEDYSFCTNPEYLHKRESIIIKNVLEEFFGDPEEYRQFARNMLLGKKINPAPDHFLDFN